MNELAPQFKSLDTSDLKGSKWLKLVNDRTITAVQTLIERNGLKGQRLPEFNAPQMKKNYPTEYEMFKSMYELEREPKDFFVALEGNNVSRKEIDEATRPARAYYARRERFYSDLADEIKRKRQFRTLPRLHEAMVLGLEPPEDSFLNVRNYICMMGVSTLYLMVCEPNRFLVGLKDVAHWKKVKIADFLENSIEEDPMQTPLVNLPNRYLASLKGIGQKELVVVPEMMVHPKLADKIIIPQTESPEVLLEQAYFNQRYLLDPEGAEVRFQNAGDIQKMIVMQTGSHFIARVITKYGDEFVSINLEDASYSGADNAHKTYPRWTGIVAQTYRDLVIAREVTGHTRTSPRTEREPDEVVISESSDSLSTVVYIPRTIQTKNFPIKDAGSRLPFNGPKRVKPHPVVGYRRRGNMTEKQRQDLRKLEQEWDIKFVDSVPLGYTFVRPHFSPSDVEKSLPYLPVYIKRRIEREITESLNNPPTIKESKGVNQVDDTIMELRETNQEIPKPIRQVLKIVKDRIISFLSP